MSNVLLLPGSKWQFKLAESIRKHGEKLFVVSPENNPPCKLIADDYFQSDIFAIDSIKEYCKKKSIDAILTDQCDIVMPVVGMLGDDMGIPTLGSSMARLYTDKYKMREFCTKNGLKSPQYKLCYTIDEAEDFFKKFNKKMIIKPIDSNSSKGIFTIKNLEDLKKYFDKALSFSRIEKAVIIEEYIDGTEFTIDGIKTPYANFPLAISEKKHFNHNENIANELFFTHRNNRFNYKKLKSEYNKFVMLSGLCYGFTHAEYKYKDGEFYLIEIGARGGGNMISSVITQFMSGYDTYDYLIDCALGKAKNKNFEINENYKNKAAVLKFFDVPGMGGIVSKINGIEYLNKCPSILEYGFNFKIGDKITDAENDSVRIGFYIAGTENEEDLKKIMQEVKNIFSIELK